MIDEKRSIKKSTAQAICDAVKVKEGTTEGVPFNEVAKRVLALPTASGENKLAQLAGGTLTEITAEDLEGITSIVNNAFQYCKSLVNVTMPNSVTSIGNEAFSVCSNLVNLIIPNSVTSIGSSAFSNCRSLNSVTMGDSIMNFNTNTASSVFYNCNNLKAVYFDGDIGFWCRGFYNYESNPIYYAKNLYIKNANGEYELLTNLIIPNSVTSIGKFAFDGCQSLTSMIIPNSVTSIDNCAFRNCRNLASVTIPNSVISIGGNTFSSCDGLLSVTIPNSVISIGDYAFYFCNNLAKVNIGNGITSIGSNAFHYTDVTDIYIDKPEGSISGSPWGASSATVHWNTPLPSEEV